ncbi:gluconate 2-dehydrogenase subunit 3 family protein [Halomarina rubra]|uniref:Gluconate 2-dehydrogenase subunit 3 family protein n=1 Tax=Halomarina rubra TaxID=2071873 RepID=A0ABD6B1M1_9EURY|nr:gluconate 2-dehydrogenase subunit 3 family protein [Halomarina rubra]
MRLTRRDALVALGATGLAGAGVGAGVLAFDDGSPADGDDETGADALLRSLAAAAEVLYPSGVEGVEEFVETYSLGRVRGRETYREGLRRAVSDLDAAARAWYGAPYADLDRDTRESVLRELGADTADADPEGRRGERIRYYVVEELLYAFYASPTGGRLAGIENPVGYPGGVESYRRGPEAARTGSERGDDSGDGGESP